MPKLRKGNQKQSIAFYGVQMKSLMSLYQTYKVCVLRITTEKKEGKLSTGTGFHIGDGYIVTARHIVEWANLVEITSGELTHSFQKIIVENIYYPNDTRIDLAVLKTNFSLEYYMTKVAIIENGKEREKEDHIQIGGHLDDMFGDELTLSRVILMGYPKVPFVEQAVLFATAGEVNAVIDGHNCPHPQFIISPMAKEGFFGGPVISEYGFLLGVLTESLDEGKRESELGFSAAISVEPLLVLLQQNEIYPASNGEFIREFMH